MSQAEIVRGIVVRPLCPEDDGHCSGQLRRTHDGVLAVLVNDESGDVVRVIGLLP